MLSSAAQHSLAGAGSLIDRHVLVVVDQVVQLADVYVEGSLTDYLSHARYSSHEEEPAVIRLILVSVLLAACTPAVPAGASPSAVPAATGPSSAPSSAPLPFGSGDTTLPTGGTPPPETLRPPAATDGLSTSAPPASCDPVYYDCEDKYTPRPVTPRPPPNADGVAVGTSPDGTYLIDEDGMSLYTFDNDSPGQSACSGDCAEAWPPLAGERPLTQLEGVEGDLSIIERDDGSAQVAYNDRPLYYYAGDRDPGDTNGHGIAGVWYVAEP